MSKKLKSKEEFEKSMNTDHKNNKNQLVENTFIQVEYNVTTKNDLEDENEKTN